MSSDSDSTIPSTSSTDSPETYQPPPHSRVRQRRFKIKRSSGEYEYVTREELKALNEQRKEKYKTRKKKRVFVLLAVLIVAAFSGGYLLLEQLKRRIATPSNAVQSGELPFSTDASQTGQPIATGVIRIQCNIDGARVYVDGNPLSPVKNSIAIVGDVSEGFHEISVQKPGYWSSPPSAVAQVMMGQIIELTFSLLRESGGSASAQIESFHDESSQPGSNNRADAVKSTGVVQVKCNLDEATVYIDGDLRGQTKDRIALMGDIQTGFHEITLKARGYETLSKYAQVVANQVTPLNFKLVKEEEPALAAGKSAGLYTSTLPSNSKDQRSALLFEQAAAQSFKPIQTDTSPPNVTILTAPDERTNQNQVKFSWDSNEKALVSIFLEGHDSGYSEFASRRMISYANLSDGKYSFYIKAKDVAGNLTPTPISQTFAVDTTPPVLEIVDGPSGTIVDRQVTFQFSAQEPGTFAFYLDGLESRYSNYMSDNTRSYHSLDDGDYAFYLKARDVVGNETAIPLVRRFRIDTSAPGASITLQPPATSADNTATFAFTSKKSAQFSYYLSGWDKGFLPYRSVAEATYTDLSDGKYTFYLRGRDALGNVDPTPATVEFTIDTTPPKTTISRSPPSVVTYQTVTFSFESNEAASFSFYLDGYDQGYSDYTSETSKTYHYLSDGEYTFYVRSKDVVNNVEVSSASHSFAVKTTEISWHEDFEGKEISIKAGDFNSKNGKVFWGKSRTRAKSEQFSLWCAGHGGKDGNYSKNMQAWYEIEIDLSYYSRATLSLWYYLDRTNDISDQFTLRAAPLTQITPNSHDGFKDVWEAPILKEQGPAWVEATISLDQIVGQPVVLRLCFDSDGDRQDEGVYIDDVQLISRY